MVGVFFTVKFTMFIIKNSSPNKSLKLIGKEILKSLNYFLRFVSIIIVPAGIALYCRAERISSIKEFFAM